MVALGGVLAGTACSRRAPEQAPPTTSSVLAEPSAAPGPPAASASGAPAAASPEAATADALLQRLVREERWADAAARLDASTGAALAEQRFLRAYLAHRLGDHARVARELEGLEPLLPLLQADIERLRLEARCEVGPFEVALAALEGRTDARSLLRAAEVAVRAGQLERARALLGKADAALGKQSPRGKPSASRSELALQLRAQRAKVLAALGEPALAAADLRWLALEQPWHPDDALHLQELARLAPQAPLGRAERLQRAQRLAARGQVERLEAELTALAQLAQGAPSAVEIDHWRAEALYVSRRDDRRAAALLDRVVRAGGPRASADLLRAARALLRVGEEATALDHLKRLTQRFPKAQEAEQARFLMARSRYLRGDWQRALALYRDYLERHPKGPSARAAEHEAAVSELVAGSPQRALQRFEALRSSTRTQRVQAEYRLLEGIALEGAKQPARAQQRYRQVIDEEPLAFSALAARARLVRLGREPGPLIPPGDAAPPLAPLVVQLPPRVALLAKLGLEGEAEQALGEAAEQYAKAHAPRGDEALCEAYAELDRAALRYRVGQRATPSAVLGRAPNERTRWMWECVYPRPYEGQVEALTERLQLPPHLIYAIMRQESGFRADIQSPAKAVGLMQLIPPTAESVAKEVALEYAPERLRHPAYNLTLGAHYLGKLSGMFGASVPLVAAAYNAGPTAVSRWLETAEQLPLDVWVARIPYEETRHYVQRVVGNLARYAYLTGGPAAVPALPLELPRGLRAAPDAY